MVREGNQEGNDSQSGRDSVREQDRTKSNQTVCWRVISGVYIQGGLQAGLQ